MNSKTFLVLRSALFNFTLRFGTYLLYVISTPLLIFGERGAMWSCRVWGDIVAFCTKRIMGINYRVHGEIPRYPCVFACKHQSAWETSVFFELTERPVYIFKKEMLWLPFFNLVMLVGGMIPVDRDGGGAGLKKLLRRVKDRVDNGRQVIIFPEGTRKKPGAEPDYKPGIAAIYKHCGVPVVPVALNSGVFWGKEKFTKKPGTVDIEFLEPIQPGMKPKEFMQELESRIEAACKKLPLE